MAQVDSELVKQNQDFGMKKKILADGTILWSGAVLRDASGDRIWFDGGYNEALQANSLESMKIEHSKRGLNFHGQTKEQEAAFKKRQEIAKKNKEKAAVLNQSIESLK